MMGVAASVIAPAGCTGRSWFPVAAKTADARLKPCGIECWIRILAINIEQLHEMPVHSQSTAQKRSQAESFSDLHLSFFYKMDAQVGYWHS